MSYNLFGFMSASNLVDNTKGVVKPVGELTTEAETYAKDKGIFALDAFPNMTLYTFKSLQEKNEVPVPQYAIENSIQLCSWIVKQCLNSQFINDHDTVLQAIQAEFRSTLVDVQIGKMVGISSTMFCPEYVSFRVLGQSENRIKIWLAEGRFRQQYTFYDIVVIPLVDNVDDYFKDPEEVMALKPELLFPDVHARANVLKQKAPYTKIITHNYDWVNVNEPTQTKTFPWTVLVYGGIGDNVDVIKGKIVDYVLENSQFTREEWEKRFPDLFVPTEFTIVPQWEKYSVPNKALVAGMFSPTVKLSEIMPLAKKVYGEGYPEAHLNAFMEISSHLYKSVSFLVCGHSQNRLTTPSFYQTWPEYALMRSVSDDFNRFSIDAQALVRMLTELFRWADESTPDTELPDHFTRLQRNGIYYLAQGINNVQYLVAMRWNWTDGKFKS